MSELAASEPQFWTHPVTGQAIEIDGPHWPPHPIHVSRSLLMLDLSGEEPDPEEALLGERVPEEYREYGLLELRLPGDSEIDWTALSETYADSCDALAVLLGQMSYDELLQKWGMEEEPLAQAA